MTIEDILEKLNDEEKKNLILKYLINEPDEEHRKIFISFIENNPKLSSLANKQILKADFIKTIQKNNIKNMIKENEVIINYQRLLENYAKLAQELSLDTSLKIAILYTYLLWNGYFSKTKTNIFQNENKNLKSGLYSYDVMNGIGVCLNYSILFNDYLNTCGIESATIINGVKEKFERDYIPPIDRPRHKDNIISRINYLLTTPITNIIGNHAFNLIRENNKFYIYDVTNLAMLKIVNCTTAENICGTGTVVLHSLVSYLFAQNDISINVLNDFITTLNFLQCPYSRRDFICLFEELLELFNKNKKLIDDCYDEVHDDIITIANYAKVKKKNI